MTTPRTAPDSRQDSASVNFNYPAALAYIAAALFIGASLTTNAVYGWQRGTDIPSAVVWCSVSIAASIVFALSWPALASASSVRRASLVAIALLVTGSYSVVAALGSASGVRADAATVEASTTADRDRLTKQHRIAADALTALPVVPAPVPQIAAIAALKATPGANGCTKIDGPVSREVCPKVAALEGEVSTATTEAARQHAQRRADLERQMQEAARGLAAIKPTRQANSDTAALNGFLVALGVTVEADTLNRILILLAVLLVECGGGLALAVAESLRFSPVSRVAEENSKAVYNQRVADLPSLSTETKEAAPALSPELSPAAQPSAQTEHAAPLSPAQAPCLLAAEHVGTLSTAPTQTTRDKVLALIAGAGGSVRASQREIATQVGCSPANAARVLRELRDAGVVHVRASATGSVVAMA